MEVDLSKAPNPSDVSAVVDGDDEGQFLPADLNIGGIGSVTVDRTARQVKLPNFKLVQDGSLSEAERNLRGLEIGQMTLNLEHLVQDSKKVTRFTILSFLSCYEDNLPFGSRAPRTMYRTVADVQKAGKTLASPPRGYEAIKAVSAQAATARECGRLLMLIEKPADIVSTMFPFAFEGKQYALARWFMTGWSIWGPGKVIEDACAVPLKPVGLLAGKWVLSTAVETSKTTNKQFVKPYLRLDKEFNSKPFVDWIRSELTNKPHEEPEAEAPAPNAPPTA